MRVVRFLWAGIACLALQAVADEEYSSEELQRLYVDNIRHLCVWAKTNAPPGNPVEIQACQPDGSSVMQRAIRDADEWWGYWRRTDEAVFDRLSKEWEAELARRNAQLVADRKTAAKKKAKADRERTIKSLPTMPVADLCRLVRRGKMPEALEALVARNASPPLTQPSSQPEGSTSG